MEKTGSSLSSLIQVSGNPEIQNDIELPKLFA